MMTKDHIMPKSKGGKNHFDNYEPMCSDCNTEKADKHEDV
jgi:5-methylcytosine-specific restriction endonuclease McrA